MGCMLSAASCNKWFCDEILKTEDYSAEQENINDEMLGNNNVFFLPYLMGERSPINDTDATGMFIGLRPDTQRRDMLLVILEGVAFAIRDSFEIEKMLGVKIEKSTVCGGGAKSKLWMKILCNVLNIELDIPKTEEGPGFGAAQLAMIACGQYKSVQECIGTEIKEIIKPDGDITVRYQEKYNKFKKIYPSVRHLYKVL